MGYAHGRKWKEGDIQKEVKKVMKQMGIERMPSNSECNTATGSYSLSNKISKSGGFYNIAKKMGLKTKDSATKKGVKCEEYVIGLIKINTGLESRKTSIASPYDILVNEKVKVEVKYSEGYKDEFYSANLYNGLQKADVLVFICRNEKIGNKNLIIPSHHLQGKTQLGVGKNSKYDKYIDCWEYIEQFNEFMENLY